MKTLTTGSIDLICCDPPFAITANSWDKPISWNSWFTEAWKVLKPNGAIVMFGNPPFSFEVLTCPLGRKHYRYDWIWKKERGSNFQHANRQPMKVHEHVHVFYRSQPTYNPIKTNLDKVLVVKPKVRKKKTDGLVESSAALYHPGGTYVGKFPESILEFSRDRPMIHPTQKPVELVKYLVQTYSNAGDTVLDTFAGYATTALACEQLGDRHCVSVELTQEWHDKGTERVKNYVLGGTEVDRGATSLQEEDSESMSETESE